MHVHTIPASLTTERLFLRSWDARDAVRLLPILRLNVDRLVGWIPAHVAAPAPVAALEARLAGFALDFATARGCRYGVFSPDERDIYGEVDLFFRSAEERVPLDEADRAEIGYWLRGDVTGRGYATEAARAMRDLAYTFPRVTHVEIRCDARNAASVAVARRLGFRLDPGATGSYNMLWIHDAPTHR